MNYLEPQGFLGTGASLLADLTLVAYVLLIVPGMIAGYIFARRGQHRPHHKNVMITITIINWLLIIFLMVVAYRFDVIGNIGQQPGNARYLMPTIHGILGLPAQLLATYVVYRMLREDTQVASAKARGVPKDQLRQYWFLSAKPLMRITLILWLATALLGVFNYLIRYNVIPSFGTTPNIPVVTEEPAATVEPASTPATTPEPAATPELDDDDNSGSGSSNSGSGSDNSGPGNQNDEPAVTPETG
jgi:uncharacterized membrane protein YozB (DUF420 family)